MLKKIALVVGLGVALVAPSYSANLTQPDSILLGTFESSKQTTPNQKISMPITLYIRIPSNNVSLKYELVIPQSSTVGQAVESVAKVGHGVVCCDNRDIKSINGLANDPYHNAWWTIRVNGNLQNYSSHSHLEPWDVVELVYSSRPASHQRLQEWLLSFSKGK